MAIPIDSHTNREMGSVCNIFCVLFQYMAVGCIIMLISSEISALNVPGWSVMLFVSFLLLLILFDNVRNTPGPLDKSKSVRPEEIGTAWNRRFIYFLFIFIKYGLHLVGISFILKMQAVYMKDYKLYPLVQMFTMLKVAILFKLMFSMVMSIFLKV